MTEQSNHTDKNNECQDPPSNSVGDIFIFPKDFTATKHTLAWLDALVGAIPPDEVYPDFYLKLSIKTMQALASIPEEISYLAMAVENQADYSDLLRELIEAIKENNRLRDKEEPPEPTSQGSYLLKPPPDKQGGSKPRREVSPGLKRLRQIERGVSSHDDVSRPEYPADTSQ